MSGGNRNFARGFEKRRGNGNFRIKGRNIREELRGDRSRGIRRQMEENCEIMKAQIPQIDLEEIPYIVTLVVNGKQCDCLVDTGAVDTLVRKRMIPVGDMDTERRTEVRLVSSENLKPQYLFQLLISPCSQYSRLNFADVPVENILSLGLIRKVILIVIAASVSR
ncbi:hypothetical protein JTB14_021254 [Gonioctena quinquepunctata]|nr:hypothetical protein JTB14_021254 [Gonioctena quinquepunctata]